MKIDPASLMNLLTPLRASADARQEKLAAQQAAKLREAQTASETLKSRSSEASEERKAAARQKIEQLKARLQMLRSMVGVDPEGIARIAAQLARELGAAVKAYASAGGNTAGMSATGAPAVASTDAGAAGAEGQAGAQSDAQAQPEAASGAEEQQGAAKGPTGEETKTSNPYQQAIDEQKSQAAESARRSGEKQADSELMAEVRRMAAELKTLIKQATDKAKAGEPDAVSPQEARELDGAAAELDRAVQQAGADLGGGLVSLLV